MQFEAKGRASPKEFVLHFWANTEVTVLQPPVIQKMASPIEKAQCVVWLVETKLPIAVQRRSRTNFEKAPPDVRSIKEWLKSFLKTGSVYKSESSGRPSVSDKKVKEIRIAIACIVQEDQ